MSENSHGNIGHQLVRSFMDRRVITVAVGTRIHLAIKALSINGIGGAPVVDSSDKVIGFVSEYDLLIQAATKDITDPISYTEGVISLAPETTLSEALVVFHKKKVRTLPVMSPSGRIVGMVSRIAILNRLIGL